MVSCSQLLDERSEPLVLRDGAAVAVRPLEREDRDALAAAVRRLSQRTRSLRFAVAKPQLTERDLDLLCDVDHHDREALVAVDPLTGSWTAVVRYGAFPGEPGAVDVAATVADEWQGRGLGTALLARLADRAREEGHLALRATVAADNRPCLRMLRRLGYVPRGAQDGQLELELRLPAPARA
jgi:GNAT superfamily N-acetyltransferase